MERVVKDRVVDGVRRRLLSEFRDLIGFRVWAEVVNLGAASDTDNINELNWAVSERILEEL